MKKSYVMIGLFVISLIGGFVCFSSSLVGYSILAFTVAAVFGLFGVNRLIGNRNPNQVYERKGKDLLNTYDSILLKCGSVPNMEGRNIIRVESMDDLVDAQFEIRKPICYLKQSESCSFVLLDEKEAYVYVEKLKEDDLSPVEIEINNMKFRNKENRDLDSEMLQDIDKTTIIKLSNKRSYKVSPIRKKNEPKEEQLEENDYTAEYLFDVDELQDVVPLQDVSIAKDEVEILDF